MIDIEKLINKYKFNPKVILYIGANEGQELNEMMELFPYSEIHCFEPQKSPFKILSKKFGNHLNVHLYNFALGNENKKVKIFSNNNNNQMSSSILKPKEHLKYHKFATFSGYEVVQMKKFEDLKIKNVDFINIDVQGYELEVLRGFGDLNNVQYIKTEVNRRELYEDCVLVKDLDKYLNEFNFLRLKTKWWNYTIPWGDAFYVKKNQVSKIEYFFILGKNKIQSVKGYFWVLARVLKFFNKIK